VEKKKGMPAPGSWPERKALPLMGSGPNGTEEDQRDLVVTTLAGTEEKVKNSKSGDHPHGFVPEDTPPQKRDHSNKKKRRGER